LACVRVCSPFVLVSGSGNGDGGEGEIPPEVGEEEEEENDHSSVIIVATRMKEQGEDSEGIGSNDGVKNYSMTTTSSLKKNHFGK
jgi:hypothetical protein